MKCYHTGKTCTGLDSFCVGCRCNPIAENASLVISYRDAIGSVSTYVDAYGVQFTDGNAIFSDLNDELHTVAAANIIQIISATEF